MSRYNFSKNSSFDHDDDISEADPNDIAKILQDTDDIDGGLFKGANKSNNNLSKTLPISANKPTATVQKNKSFNFDDDPLADLDTLIGKKQNMNNTSNKPPLSSTMPVPNRPAKSGINFDDTDDYGIFDSKPRTNTKPAEVIISSSTSGSKSKSLVDDLFGREKKDDKSNTNTNTNSDFKLNDKYLKMSQEPAQSKTDDDFSFGGYVPSSMSGTQRTNTALPKRNVSFNDDLFSQDMFSSRPKTSPAESLNNNNKKDNSNSLMKTMPTPAKSNEFDFDFESLLKPKNQGNKPTPNPANVENNLNSSDLNGLENSFNRRRSSLNDSKLVFEKPPMASRGDQSKLAANTKDSMNSSFADSIEIMDTKPPGSTTLNSFQPLQFDLKHIVKHEQDPMHKMQESSEAGEDGWLSNLIGNKKTTQNKKPNVDNSVHYDSNELQSMLQKIKQLEFENQDLHMQLQHNKSHYELQIQLIQDSCENRLRMLKDDRETSLKHFKEEKDMLQNHIDLIEKEKNEMSMVYKRKVDDKQKDFDLEIEKLKQLHRDTIDNLKVEHEDILKRVKQMKETEISAAIAASSHTKTIESVINLIEGNTKNLDEISHKVQIGHMMNLNEHEVQLRNKEEQLKIKEERLLKQQKEYEHEIRLLNETIQRLENHLAEQSKAVAEERWKGKQQEKKMEAFQEALINEQRITMDKLARERNDIERSKDEILVEQKRLMQQVYEDRRKIAEEKAHLEASLNAYKDKQHKDSLSNINIEAEISVSSRRMNDEKSRLEQLKLELREKEMELKQEKLKLEEKKQEMDMKIGKLEQISMVVNQKYKDAEELFMKSNREKDSQMKILEQANSIKSNHDSRLNQIQQQLMSLNERETQINQEKVALYKQRQELEVFKSIIICTKCKDPVKDVGVLGLTSPSSGYGTGVFNNANNLRYRSSLMIQSNNNDFEDAKLMRQFKVQALRDRQFINEEKRFIDNLKSNSVMSKAFSMNQLNSTIA